MSSPPVTSAVLRQLDAALQLMETMLPSLTIGEIVRIRLALGRSYGTMGTALQARLDEASGTALTRKYSRPFSLTLS